MWREHKVKAVLPLLRELFENTLLIESQKGKSDYHAYHHFIRATQNVSTSDEALVHLVHLAERYGEYLLTRKDREVFTQKLEMVRQHIAEYDARILI